MWFVGVGIVWQFTVIARPCLNLRHFKNSRRGAFHIKPGLITCLIEVDGWIFISWSMPSTNFHGIVCTTIKVMCESHRLKHSYYTGIQILGRKCPLFGFWRIPTNFWSLNPNLKSVFGSLVWILHCCQFCVFKVKIYIFFELFSKFIFIKTFPFLIWKENIP